VSHISTILKYYSGGDDTDDAVRRQHRRCSAAATPTTQCGGGSDDAVRRRHRSVLSYVLIIIFQYNTPQFLGFWDCALNDNMSNFIEKYIND